MDDIVNKVAEKTGVNAETVKKVLTTAVGFIEDKLPAPLAGQLDNLMGGGGEAPAGGGTGLGDIANKIGGMFGGGKS